MRDKNSSLKVIFRSTSLLGGLQVFIILVNIIKSKVIAVFLGPSGFGLFGILTSTLGVVSGFTNFGLSISAVKKITESSELNENAIGESVYIISKVAFATGLLGMLFTVVFSGTISQIAFGNLDYSMWIKLLSITILINQLTIYRNSLFQGIGQLKLLVKASFWGSICSLSLSLPFYYYFSNYSILASILISSVMGYFFAIYFEKKLEIKTFIVKRNILFTQSIDLIKVGFFISLSLLLGTCSAYMTQIVITKIGGIKQVGLYLAGFAIVNNYVGIIFSAMSTEYYPRLTLNSRNLKLSNITINQQSSIVLLVLSPLLILFIIFLNVILLVLYSSDFLVLNQMMYWTAIGIYFKCLGWPIAYYFLAAGASKLYFFNELIAVIYSFVFSVIAYYFFGLVGLGYAYLATQILYFLQCSYVANYHYGIFLRKKLIIVFIYQLLLGLLVLIFNYSNLNSYIVYLISIVVFLLSVILSIKYFKIKLLNYNLFKL
jgi:O-antigen/teichoic acid export membrane protein